MYVLMCLSVYKILHYIKKQLKLTAFEIEENQNNYYPTVSNHSINTN